MTDGAETDICVIGASAGGLTLAMGAAEMGARVILVTAGMPVPADSVERFGGLGVGVLDGPTRFADSKALMVGDRAIRAKRFVIAVGTRSLPPVLAGLDQVDHLTPETLPALSENPAHLVVVGGGERLVALAQERARKGAKVTLIVPTRLLPQEDPELVTVLRQALLADGVDVREDSFAIRVASADTGVTVELTDNQGKQTGIGGTHLLLAGETLPDIAGLGLDLAGITIAKGLIAVDRRLRTSNACVYAIGDCIGGIASDALANYQAGIVLKNILFRLAVKANSDLVPHVISTHPQLARVGLSESAAKARYKDVRTQERAFEGGLVKAILRSNGQILGVGIVAPQAAEMLAPWCLALSRNLRLSALAGMLPPDSSCAAISKRLAGDFYASRLQGPGVRAVVRGLMRFA